MFMLIAKLNWHKLDVRPCDMFHIDLLPQRLDRKEAPGGGSAEELIKGLPLTLVQHWGRLRVLVHRLITSTSRYYS